MARARTTGPDFNSHRRDAEQEDVAWLLARGVLLRDACARVGVEVQTYEKRLTPERSKGR